MAGIYIHIPFCKQACYYCNFHFSTQLKNQDILVNAILNEIELKHKDWKQFNYETIYFGGGTPSVLDTIQIEKILEKLNKYFNIQAKEITLEANPDDLNIEKIKALQKIGINRLSIGIQSFYDEDLLKLNRSHNAKQAELAIKNAQDLGITNLSIDLIYGIPGLSNKKWKNNIQKVIDFDIPHVSAYALTVEEKTALAHFIKTKKFKPISDEQSANQFNLLRTQLIANNFLHYEISNFGKEGFLSQHNTSYWNNVSYLGLGPSAHSFQNNYREWNIANNSIYIKRIREGKNYSEKEILSPIDLYNEQIMTGLRTVWGVNLSKIEKINPDFKIYLIKESEQFINDGKLILDKNFLIANSKYLFLIEGIITDLFKV